MKVLCNACEAAEAKLMCCADEAALCLACDERVHAANKLAEKHLRIPLISSASSTGCAGTSASVPKCDICQESSGYFFCLEDRALLCRNCDMSIHSANPYVSSHRRFLLTGVQVGLESTENPNPTSRPVEKPPPIQIQSKFIERSTCSSMSGQVSWDGDLNTITGTAGMLSDWTRSSNNDNMVFSSVSREGGGTANKMMPGGSFFSGNDWPLDELFGLRDYNYNNSGFGFTENGSSGSKGQEDSGKLGSSESSEMDGNECIGVVPEISSWTVPELPSPPTASGFHWPPDLHFQPYAFDNSASVPDISSSARFQRRRCC